MSVNAPPTLLSGRTSQGQALLPSPEQASPLATPLVQASHIRMTVTAPLFRSRNAWLPNARPDDVYSMVTVSIVESLNTPVPRSLQPGVIMMQSSSTLASLP